MAGGRPTKYTEEFLTLARDYLNNFERDYGDSIPSVAGLADVADIRRETLHEWARQDDKEEFSNILAKILARQEKTLINKGLTGEFNSNITKLALGKHGYHDKQDNNQSGDLALTIGIKRPE